VTPRARRSLSGLHGEIAGKFATFIGAAIIRTTLTIVETRSGKEIQFQDEKRARPVVAAIRFLVISTDNAFVVQPTN
jgi:hypothetical protein